MKVASATRDSESSGLPVVGDKGGITFVNITTGWITGGIVERNWLFLYVTHDSGRTWRRQDLSLPSGLTLHWNVFTKPPEFFTPQAGILPAYYTLLPDSPSQRETGLVVFYVTRDSGSVWTQTTPVSLTHGDDASSSFADVNHGWVADGGVLYVTSDGGYHWATMRPGPPFASADVRQLDFVSPRVGWAVC